MDAIARVYAELIKKGEKTIEDVPAGLRDLVERYLNENEGE